jgi:hypothetical protein
LLEKAMTQVVEEARKDAEKGASTENTDHAQDAPGANALQNAEQALGGQFCAGGGRVPGRGEGKYDVKTISSPKELGDFYDEVRKNPSVVATRIVARITPERAAEAEALIKKPVKDFDYSVDSSALNHNKKTGHEDPKAELPRGQIPLTRDDYEKIPSIVEKGKMSLGGESGANGEPRIVFQHSEPSHGRYHYVAEFRPSRKRLAMVQMHKFKNRRAVYAFLNRLTSTSETCSQRVLDGAHTA